MANEPGAALWDAAEIAERVAAALSERQATDIVLLDIRRTATFADFFVIASATSERHMNALVEAVEKALGEHRIKPLRVEGVAESGWILMDYGPVIVHIFSPDIRAYYNLEGLWAKSASVVQFA